MDLCLVFETDDDNDEDFWRTEYKPVVQQGRILYGNVAGPKTLMIAWKQLIKDKNEYSAESQQYLHQGPGFRHAQFANQEQEAKEEGQRTFVLPTTSSGLEKETIDLCQTANEEEEEEDGGVALGQIERLSILTAERP